MEPREGNLGLPRPDGVPGAEFGEDTCIRFSYATSRERIATGLTRIGEAVENLGKYSKCRVRTAHLFGAPTVLQSKGDDVGA